MIDSHRRTLAKTLSWRLLATIITGCVALVITGKLTVALSIGLLDTAIKLGAYYTHERLWNQLSFGRGRPSDYEI